MDCGGVFVKYVLFIFNILFVVCGILLIVFGSIMVSHIDGFTNFSDTWATNSIPISILVLGCIIFIISFLGCCGAIRENSCCMSIYSVFMLLLFMCQLALIIFVWSQRDKLMDNIGKVVPKIWDQRKTDKTVMEALEITFNCCGNNAFTDYSLHGESIPLSCCGAKATTCGIADAMLKPGCSRAFSSFWESKMDIIRYAGLGVAAVELVAFIFACCLANQVRNNHRRAHY